MTENLFSIEGKTALVTGGSGGIGLALAKGLARHGSNVIIVSRNQQKLTAAKEQIQKETSQKVWTFAYDMAEPDGIAELFAKITDQTGPIDILVNNAGTAKRDLAEDFPLADWQGVMKVNLDAVFFMCQSFCRHRKQNGNGGKIINIGSLMCRAARPLNPPYAASKGGLLLLTKALAVEWVKYDINVNAIGPGFFPTDMTGPLKQRKEFDQWVISRTPMGRWGRTEELVGTAVFLASKASEFVTGQIIYVDGGWDAAL